MSKYLTSLLLISIILYGCGKSKMIVNGVSSHQWKLDKNGCNGYRDSVASFLIAELKKLEGIPEAKVRDLFGIPDQNELLARNQKFFSYWISNSPNCENGSDNVRKLVLRLTTLGIVQSARIYEVNNNILK